MQYATMHPSINRLGAYMAATGTLNIRLDRDLKESGMQVLERNNVSVSEAVRRLFVSMAQAQELPECLCAEGANAAVTNQRQASFRSSVTSFRELPNNPQTENLSNDEIWQQHLLEKYGVASPMQ